MILKEKETNRLMEEIYDLDLQEEEVETWCHETIQSFNDTLRAHEKPREFLTFRVLGNNNKTKHKFTKTNLVTIIDKKGVYDCFRCDCGVTGKRFTLGGDIIRDKEFKAKKYNFCI